MDAAAFERTAGLCSSCGFAEVIQTKRGSRFWRCGLSDRNPRFPKYPRLPVVACDGYEPSAPA